MSTTQNSADTTNTASDIGWVVGGFFIAFFVTLLVCIICIAPFVIRWLLHKVIDYFILILCTLFLFLL